MTLEKQQTSTAYLLHKFKYKETSLIGVFLTPNSVIKGILPGAFKNYKKGSVLQLYTPIEIAYRKKDKELQNIYNYSIIAKPYIFVGLNSIVAMYINELLYKTLISHDLGNIYYHYDNLLKTLDKMELSMLQIELLLRKFEWQLLFELGISYALLDDASGNKIKQNSNYIFVNQHGFQEQIYNKKMKELPSFHGYNLINFHNFYSLNNTDTYKYLQSYSLLNLQLKFNLRAFKNILRQEVDRVINYKPIVSRRIFARTFSNLET